MRFFVSTLLAGILLAAAAFANDTAAISALRVGGLRCEWGVDPLGIDVTAPGLSWRLTAGTGAATAWEIMVAGSDQALAQDRAELWDSGRQPATGSSQVAYAGLPLASLRRVAWKVRVWDQNGRISPWSAPAHWTMGLLSAQEWKGAWIVAPGETESLLLRREFTVGAGLRRAIACVCGLGQYEFSCDGRKVGSDFLAPGWTTYAKTTLYDTRDLTSLLHQGRNALGLFLGNGMYDVILRDRFTKFTGFDGPLRAILHLRLEYNDGHVEDLGTDTDWRTLAGPLTFDSIYGGEDEDERLLPSGWNQPGFDDRHWMHAVPFLNHRDTLRGFSCAADPIRTFQVQTPVAQRSFPDGSIVYDFGQNAAHIPRIVVTGPAGSSVRLTPAEIVDAAGAIDRSTMGGTLRGSAWWQYTKATDRPETWSPRFCYIGFRYLKAEFLPSDDDKDNQRPALSSIAAVVVHSDAPEVGAFAASNPLLGRIHDLVLWAQRSNLVSVFTDCPHREKLGWLEQTHLNGPSLRYNFDLARNFRKTIHDMSDAQAPTGMIPEIAPEYVIFDPPFRTAAEWGAAFVLVPWQQYEFTGDLTVLRQNYPSMRRYLAYLDGKAVDDILSEGLGDWYDLGPNRPGFAQLTPAEFTASAFYFEDTKVLGKIAGVVGRAQEAEALAEKAEEIRRKFNRKFFRPDQGFYGADSQCANAMALAMGMVEQGERARVLDALVKDIVGRGYGFTAGDVGYRYLLLALAEGGRSDVIYRMIDQDDKPGYGFILKQGATSLTEAWDANRHASWNHFMLGQIEEWFYGYLAGIGQSSGSAGWDKILFRPQPVGDLTWAEASYRSVRGTIGIRWQRDGDELTVKTIVPAGCTAALQMPPQCGGRMVVVKEGVSRCSASWSQ